MRLPIRLSALFLIGVLAAGSTALGYYFYFVYDPPLETAAAFIKAMEYGDLPALKRLTVVSKEVDAADLREPTNEELHALQAEPFEPGRILDQRIRQGPDQDFYYLVYREPSGNVYALVVTRLGGVFRVVIPERRVGKKPRYLWEFTWTN